MPEQIPKCLAASVIRSKQHLDAGRAAAEQNPGTEMSVPPGDAADDSRRSSRPASNASSTTSNRHTSHPPDEEYIPTEFFDDFDKDDFLEGLVEKSDDEKDDDTGGRHRSTERSSSPVVQNCLKEIDKLTQDIRRRKRMLVRELSAAGSSSNRDRRTSRRRSRSRSPVSSSEHRRQSTFHQRQQQRTGHNSHRYGSRSPPARSRSRSRELRRRMDARRARHASQSPPPSRSRTSGGSRPSAGMSFLDELTHTFAKQGKQFPEKDLLLQQQQWRDNGKPDAKRTRLTSPTRPRTTLLSNPDMTHLMQPVNAMPLAHGMLPNPAYQQQPQQLYQQPYSNLMAAANAIVPPPQSMPLLPQPDYANAYGTGNHAYGGHMTQNSLLPTPMLNMPMQLPLADPIPITIIPDLSPDPNAPLSIEQVKARGKPFMLNHA